MSKYYILEDTPSKLTLIKSCKKVNNESKDNIITITKHFSDNDTCEYCGSTDIECWFYKINGMSVSFDMYITYDKHKIHLLTIPTSIKDVANIFSGRSEIYQLVPLLNMFMKRYYNKQQYIPHENCYNEYRVMRTSNMLISHETDELIGIEVLNKRLFKHIIVIVKCIVNSIQKKLKSP